MTGSESALEARAILFTGPREVTVGRVPLTEAGEGQVLVRTCYSGISAGSEMLAYRGDVDPDLPVDETIGALGGTFTYPFRYGYSCVGRVERSAGDLAEGSLVFAFHPHQDRFVVSAPDVIPVPEMDARVATLLPLVETALQLSLDAGPVAYQPVVVLGLGVLGVLIGALLSRSGARVIAAEPLSWRRQAAAAFGLGAVAPAELDAAVHRETSGAGVPLLIEASGSPAALASGLRLLAHEGTALVASWYGTKPVALPLGAEFHRRRLTIRSSQVSTIPATAPGRWTVSRRRLVARALMAELPLAVLATHTFAFPEAAAAYAALDRGEVGLLHAALRYE